MALECERKKREGEHCVDVILVIVNTVKENNNTVIPGCIVCQYTDNMTCYILGNTEKVNRNAILLNGKVKDERESARQLRNKSAFSFLCVHSFLRVSFLNAFKTVISDWKRCSGGERKDRRAGEGWEETGVTYFSL